LYAKPGTETFAITDGTIVATTDIVGYGHVVLLEFQFEKRTLYALYAHLQKEGRLAAGTKVREGKPGARTGVSGNASGEPPHLHFEVWTKRHVHKFPDGRISPGEILGYHFDNMDNRMPLRDMG
jgi:murein DD-endopeptidase MepM/ murein hydrolase activator NlpD